MGLRAGAKAEICAKERRISSESCKEEEFISDS